MATADTVDLGEVHPPKQESIKLFGEIEKELKHELIKLRHTHDKHEPEYFAAAKGLSDKELTSFTVDDFQQVRVAVVSYGIILFGKLRVPTLPADGPAYIHFRAFSTGPDDPPKFHSFLTEMKEEQGGGKTFRAIFTEKDKLEWFDT